MASPELEDGFTRIANELLEAILEFDFSKRELNIVFAIIRKTYGYNKKSDDISLSQIAKLTGLKSPHISCSIRDLSAKKVLLIQEGKYGQNIEFNKKYKQWKGLPKQERYQNSNPAITKTVTKGLPKQEPQKTTPKDNTKKKREGVTKTVILPPNLNKAAWNEFIQHRKDINKKLSDLSSKKNINILIEHSFDDQQLIVDKTITNSWQGLFPLNNNQQGTNHGQSGRLSAPERVRRANEENRKKREREIHGDVLEG